MNRKHFRSIIFAIIFVNLGFNTQCKRDKDPSPGRTGIDESVLSVQGEGCNCTFDIAPDVTNIDGNSMGIKPGDVICVQAGNRSLLRIDNVNGSADNPVLIKNCGGQVIVKHNQSHGAIDIKNSSHFKFMGNGAPNVKYGFKVAGTGHNSTGLSLGSKSTDFEIAFVEICNTGFAGVKAKTDGAIGWTMSNINFHDNYIHDVVGEGFYIGETKTPSHNITNVKIWNNIVARAGWESFQIANGTQDISIYNNVFYKGGSQNVRHQNNGFQIGDNTTGKFYNNVIMHAHAIGNIINGSGNIEYYNNYVDGTGENAFFIDSRTVTLPGTSIVIRDNYVKNIAKEFFLIYSSANTIEIKNNHFAGENEMVSYKNNAGPGNVIFTDNSTNDFPDIQFMDLANDDFRLASGSPYTGIGLIEPFSAPASPAFSAPAPQASTGQSALSNAGIKTSSSSFRGGDGPEKTLDNDMQSVWSSDGSGQWISYDLGRIRNLKGLDIHFQNGDSKVSYFDIEVSMDNNNWINVYAGESSGAINNYENFSFASVNARFIRIVGKGNSEDASNAIVETRILI